MSVQIWTPGMAGPLDEFIARIARMIDSFTREHGLEQAEVRLELADGSRHVLATMAPEPGFGFFSFAPYAEVGDEPRRVVVPIGAVKTIEISSPDSEHPFGFVFGDEG